MDRDGPYGPNGQQALPQKKVCCLQYCGFCAKTSQYDLTNCRFRLKV